MNADDFEAVRRDPDPIRRGRRATELLTTYQQRLTELARLRRAAVEEAHREKGLSYTEIAAQLGITKGRITQIRGSAPPAERAFFGVGPVSIALPLRTRHVDRERVVVAAEDIAAVDQLEAQLGGLALTVIRGQLRSDATELPPGDSIVVCGPKSAPIARQLLDRDPVLAMVESEGRWWLEDRPTGERHGSPMDDAESTPSDIAYLARHQVDGRTVIHIAGIHSIGSLGVTDYLANNLTDLFAKVGENEFSAAVRCTYNGLDITASEIVAGPYGW